MDRKAFASSRVWASIPQHEQTNKQCFPYVQKETLLQSVSIAACTVIGDHWKESGSNLFATSIQVFMYIDKISSELSLLNSLSAFS